MLIGYAAQWRRSHVATSLRLPHPAHRMPMLPPIHLTRWIDEHRDQLKPPIGNKVLYKDSEFIIMIVGGPNARTDFHISESEEFFYMLEGDMTLRVEENGALRDIPIKEGEVFLLSSRTPHSPQRTPGSIGLVIERTRREGELDGVRWYCDNCQHILYEEFFVLHDIVEQLRQIVEKFNHNDALHTCSRCGKVAETPSSAAQDS